jgi:hypothetical protein
MSRCFVITCKTAVLVVFMITLFGCRETKQTTPEVVTPLVPNKNSSYFFRGGEQYTYRGQTTINKDGEERQIEIEMLETVNNYSFNGEPAFLIEYKVDVSNGDNNESTVQKELIIQRGNGQIEQAAVSEESGILTVHNPLVISFPSSPEVGWELEQTAFDKDGTRQNLRTKIIGKQSVVFEDNLIDVYHIEEHKNGEQVMEHWFAPSISAPVMITLGKSIVGEDILMKLIHFSRP